MKKVEKSFPRGFRCFIRSNSSTAERKKKPGGMTSELRLPVILIIIVILKISQHPPLSRFQSHTAVRGWRLCQICAFYFGTFVRF